VKQTEFKEKEKKVEALIDQILKILLEKPEKKVRLVGHRFPDDDVWLCFWMAKKFIPEAKEAEICFVNAGQALPGSEGDPHILHFDTGGGEYDQHGKGFKKTSSATILAERLDLLKDPGIKPLLEMVTAVDNIRLLPPTSIHYAIEGYPRDPKFKNQDGIIDWQMVQERVFELFDIVYNQETRRVQSRENLKKYAEWTTLPNGLKIASILWHPELREAAFEAGAAVLVWTQSRGPGRFYTGIQRSREYEPLRLDNIAATLRFAEAQVRGINVQGKNLLYIGREGPITSWYLHDSLGLILNGSRSWKPTEDEYTKLQPRQIVGLIHKALSAIPSEVVSRWNSK